LPASFNRIPLNTVIRDAKIKQTVWKVVNSAVGVSDFQSRAVGEPNKHEGAS
jgi:hypothetical protein